jgi:hypothetical protein
MKPKCIYRIGLLRHFGIQAITLFPFILFAESQESVSDPLMRHELEHILQVQRLGFFRFYFLYLKYYFLNRFRGLRHHQAYLEIPFEVEARSKEEIG